MGLFAAAAAAIAAIEAAIVSAGLFLLKFAAITALTYFAGKLFGGRAPSFSSEQKDRKHIIRSAISPWRIIYGQTMVSGVLAFPASTDGEATGAGEANHNLKIHTLAEEGDTEITLYADSFWHPQNIVDLTIEEDTEFTITGDETTYTVQTEATAINLGDSENIYKIDLTISPALNQDAVADTATSLNLVETIPAVSGMKKKYIHFVIALAAHEVEEIGDVYFNDKIPHEMPITSSQVANPGVIVSTRPHGLETGDNIWIAGHSDSTPDINGKHTVTVIDTLNFTIPENVTVGGTGGTFKNYRFYGGDEAETPYFRISKHLGATDQEADADLVSEVAAWTTDHRLRGRAYIYCRLRWDLDVWPTGIPNIKAVVKGKLLYDPRTRVDVTSSSIADPTVITATDHGLVTGDRCRIENHSGSTPDINGEWEVTRINDNTFTIPVEVTEAGADGYCTKVAWSNNWALAMRDYLDTEYGEGCDLEEIDDDFTNAAANICDEGVELYPAWENDHEYAKSDRVLESDPDIVYRCIVAHTSTALKRPPNQIYWRFESVGSGCGSQKRYTCDGSYTLDMTPREIMSALATGAAAPAPVWTNGQYRIFAGAYRAPEEDAVLTDDDLCGPLQIQPRVSRQDLYNAVRGVYTDPLKSWEPTGFPPVTNATYEEQDNDQRIFRDVELPFTQDYIRAQRIAKIYLEKSRQGITSRYPCKLKGYKFAVMDTLKVTNSKLGWDEKIFQDFSWEIAETGGINLELQEEASSCYDWNYGEATLIDPAPDTDLPSPWYVDAPTNVTLTEVVYRDGDRYLSKVICTWTEGREYSIINYVIEAAVLGSDVYHHVANTKQPFYEDTGVPRGQYTVRVKAVNLYNVSSAWASANITVYGTNTILASAALKPPIDPKLYFNISPEGYVNQIRFRCKYKMGAGGVPDGIAVLGAITERENCITLGADNDTSLVMVSSEIFDGGTFGPILAGSTRSRLVVATATNPQPTDIDLGGHYWCQFGTSQWRKASSYDATGINFDEPFDEDPVPDDMINYFATAWADNRDAINRLLYVANNGSYEIIKWGKVQQSEGIYTFEDCVRAQEGTSQLNVANQKAFYYPAPASGTQSINFPINTFREVAGQTGVYEASQNTNLMILPGNWGSSCAAAYANVDRGIVRSYLIPCVYGGPYV